MNTNLIAVITYKRPLWLKRLLTSLTAQSVRDELTLEILVVDNDCDPEIEKIINQIDKNSPFRIFYKNEETKGIVFARNCAVDYFLSKDYRNLIFIDDDEWPQNDTWAQTMIDSQVNYRADIITGPVISVGEPGTPEWAVDLIYGKAKNKEETPVKVFYTNNLLLARHVLQKIRPAFDSRFAMTGASDYHFALKCSRMSFTAMHIDAPVMEEFPKSRATIKWFLRRGFRSGIGYTRSHLFEENLMSATVRCVAMAGVRALRGGLYLLVGLATINKLKVVDGLFRFSSSVGTVMGFFGIKYNEYIVTHGK